MVEGKLDLSSIGGEEFSVRITHSLVGIELLSTPFPPKAAGFEAPGAVITSFGYRKVGALDTKP